MRTEGGSEDEMKWREERGRKASRLAATHWGHEGWDWMRCAERKKFSLTRARDDATRCSQPLQHAGVPRPNRQWVVCSLTPFCSSSSP